MSETTKSESSSAAREAGGLVGRQVGDYVVQRLIGVGGMGEVYLAEQVSLRRPVALKVLRADLARDPQYLKRFESEATAISPIQHPNIVSVYSIGQEGDIHFIAFEYVRGMNLRHYIDRQGPMEESRCLLIACGVAAALVRAAEAGIVHRDIKPENVLLTKRGEVKVADFGLARQLGAEDVRLTQTGVTMGTPLYMSPEQIQGHAIDARSDVYSLGVMCYHMLAGEPPYRGETAMAVAIQHVHGEPASLADLRPDVRREFLHVIRRMMAKDPRDRYSSPGELLRDLERLRTGEERFIELMPGTEPGAASRRLREAWRRVREGVTRLVRPPLRYWTVSASIVAAVGLGAAATYAAVSWSGRRNEVEAAFPPEIESIKPLESGYMQLEYARNGLEENQREAGLWAVLIRFRGDDRSTIQASRDLAYVYLRDRRYDDLKQLAQYLIEREDPDQQACGYMLKGIGLSRQRKARESDAAFEQMLKPFQGSSLDWTQFDWLLRQFFLSVRQNDEILGRDAKQSAAKRERYWQVLRAEQRPAP